MPGWFYLSYAIPGEFLGAAIVRGSNVIEADEEAKRLGIDPPFPPMSAFGGKNYNAVQGGPWPDEPPSGFANRLLSRADVMALDGGNSN